MPVELGLGILELGKPWGYARGQVPPESEAIALLQFAFELGIRYFDSAASYGAAEQRLGKFLRCLTPAQRSQITVATKFGEHWDFVSNQPYVDHSFAALSSSLMRSMETLGRIDVLQLHKTTPEVLRSHDLEKAWDLALSLGIPTLGASVSDTDSAAIVCTSSRYKAIQMPFNAENQKFRSSIRAAREAGMCVALNRPFAMGKVVQPDGREAVHEKLVSAFDFVLAEQFDGAVLSGTSSKAHLNENWQAFRQALEHRGADAGSSPAR